MRLMISVDFSTESEWAFLFLRLRLIGLPAIQLLLYTLDSFCSSLISCGEEESSSDTHSWIDVQAATRQTIKGTEQLFISTCW